MRPCRVVALAVHAAASSAPKVLLTREEGKNDKLRNALTAKGFQCVELPLIEHSDGPDRWGYRARVHLPRDSSGRHTPCLVHSCFCDFLLDYQAQYLTAYGDTSASLWVCRRNRGTRRM